MIIQNRNGTTGRGLTSSTVSLPRAASGSVESAASVMASFLCCSWTICGRVRYQPHARLTLPSLEGQRGVTYLILYRILDDELDNLDGSLLAQTMDPVHCLVLDRRVPPRVHHEHHRGFSQVLSAGCELEGSLHGSNTYVGATYQGDTTCFEGNEEYSDSRVVHKVLNRRISLLGRHAAFQSADLERESVAARKQTSTSRPDSETYIEAGALESEGNEVEERNELGAGPLALESTETGKGEGSKAYKTRDLVVQSFLRSFSSSSTRASSLVLLLHLDRSSLDRIPCRAFLVLPSVRSIASASRSIEISIWHTGHSGWGDQGPAAL